MTVLLATLPPGAAFRLPLTGLTGTVKRVTTSSATVRYDHAAKVAEIRDRFTGAVIRTFEVEARPVNISARTEVEAL